MVTWPLLFFSSSALSLPFWICRCVGVVITIPFHHRSMESLAWVNINQEAKYGLTFGNSYYQFEKGTKLALKIELKKLVLVVKINQSFLSSTDVDLH